MEGKDEIKMKFMMEGGACNVGYEWEGARVRRYGGMEV